MGFLKWLFNEAPEVQEISPSNTPTITPENLRALQKDNKEAHHKEAETWWQRNKETEIAKVLKFAKKRALEGYQYLDLSDIRDLNKYYESRGHCTHFQRQIEDELAARGFEADRYGYIAWREKK